MAECFETLVDVGIDIVGVDVYFGLNFCDSPVEGFDVVCIDSILARSSHQVS